MTTAKPGTAATTDTFGYNQTGDTTSRVLAGQPGHALAWDPEDRLASDTVNGQATSFVYTPEGARLLRRDPTHTTLYLPDGTELRADRGTGQVAGTRYYTHAGRTIAVRQGSTLTWLAADHHGTAMFAVDAATLAVDRRRWLPFGQLRGTQPSWPGERGFVGGTADPITGLTHLGARDYDPATGRFVSVDPVMDLADPQQMHGYTYANNNPLTFSDPTGLIPTDDYECGNHPGGCAAYHNGGGGNSGGADPLQKTKDKLNSPAKNEFGKGPSKGGLANLRKLGYRGSPDFTYADAIEFAMQGDKERNLVCIFFQGTDSECAADNNTFFDRLVDIAYELTPIADAIHCVKGEDSCLWLLTNVAPPLKGLKVPKIVDNAVDASNTARKACSFDGDTKVLMADGTTRPIRDVKVGDQVLATNPETGEHGSRTVTAVWAHQDTVLDLELENGATLTTTEDHPFWNDTERVWQRADQLDPGDLLRAADGQQVHVGGLRPGTAYSATAYNLTISGVHTYYVVAGHDSVLVSVLVHNSCPVFVPGQRYRDTVRLSNGEELNIFADIEAEGSTLIARNVSVAPRFNRTDRGSLGVGGGGEMMRLIHDVYGAQAKVQGYTHLRIVGKRVTGPVGHIFDHTFELR